MTLFRLADDIPRLLSMPDTHRILALSSEATTFSPALNESVSVYGPVRFKNLSRYFLSSR